MTNLPPQSSVVLAATSRGSTAQPAGCTPSQKWLLLHVPPEPNAEHSFLEANDFGEWGDDYGQQYASHWFAAQCGSCDRPSLWYRDTMVYPHTLGRPPHPDMPDQVRELYAEAAAVATVSRRAGAAFARVTVERLIKQLDPDAPNNANLVQRIVRIKQRGISTSLGQMLDVVRVAGNGAVHVKDNPNDLVVLVLDDDQGPGMMELLRRPPTTWWTS